MRNAGWRFGYKTTSSGDTDWYDQGLGNFVQLGRLATNGTTTLAALFAQDAWQIDKKADDGIPGTGRIVTYKPTAAAFTPNCSLNPGPNDSNSTYNLTFNQISCALAMSVAPK